MRRLFAFVLLGPLLASCGASTPRVPTPSELTGLPEVTVSLDPQIDAERVQVFQQQDGTARLRNALLDELADSRRSGQQVNEIRLLVTRFRLRSTASGVLVGAMAGADMLDVAVTVRGQTVRTFNAGAGGVAAGFIKPSATGRFNGLVRLVAERIVKEL